MCYVDKFVCESLVSPYYLLNIWVIYFVYRNEFYQFGELRSVAMVPRQQCAFIQFTTRSAAEEAAEKAFNKIILKGRRLNIKWGRAQAQQNELKGDEPDRPKLPPVPGLPACTYFEHRLKDYKRNFDSNSILKLFKLSLVYKNSRGLWLNVP